MSDPTYTPDAQGRGAWTTTGGLLPIRPGSTSSSGYYRLAATGEAAVGSAYVRRANPDRSDAARSVNLGTRALQALVGLPPADRDGWYGMKTDEAVKAAQTALGVAVDGIAGRATLRALLTLLITAEAKRMGVPLRWLGGILVQESALDPAAVGYTSPDDHGLAQINLAAHPEVTIEQAMDPDFAIAFTAADLRATYEKWVGKTTVDPWVIAVANHNSPKAAKAWALAGAPVPDPTRAFPIEQYVQKVGVAW